MNRDEIIAMAKEAGARSEHWATRLFPAVQFLFTPDDLSRFAALVAAKERERFALECIDLVAFHGGSVELEAAIRARGTKEGA